MGFALGGELFGMGGSAGGGANAAAKQNAYQQFLIDSGSQDVNAVFGGGQSAPQYFASGGPATAGTTYYKGKYSPSPGGRTFGYVPVKRKAGQGTKGLYTQIPGQSYTGFTPNFYNNAANAYDQWANPQLGQQYNQALGSLQAGMAGQGLLGSSAYKQGLSQLNTAFGQQQQNVVDTGLQQAQSLQSNVEAAREAALGQLYQTANPGQANTTALNLASQVQAPSAYAPLGNAFSSILGNLAMQQAYGNTPQLGYYAPATNNYSANTGAIPQNTY